MARTSHGEGFKIEIDLDNASPKSVWNQISTARGLSEWIAPRVDVSLRKIHVFWDETGDDRSATVTDLKKGVYPVELERLPHKLCADGDRRIGALALRLTYGQ